MTTQLALSNRIKHHWHCISTLGKAPDAFWPGRDMGRESASCKGGGRYPARCRLHAWTGLCLQVSDVYCVAEYVSEPQPSCAGDLMPGLFDTNRIGEGLIDDRWVAESSVRWEGK